MSNKIKRGKRYRIRIPTPVIIAVTFAIALLSLWRCGVLDDVIGRYTTPQQVSADGKLAVHIIDVGQGDSVLISTPEGVNMLIDAGPNSSEDALRAYLGSLGVTELDYAVFTHPHEDHIGGGDMVLSLCDVKRVMLTDVQTDTSTFERLLEAIDAEEDCEIELASADRTYVLSENVSFTILAPRSDDDYEDDLNNASIVLRLVYGETSFLFTGDAEYNSEMKMLAELPSAALDADVLKVGHHGSVTSTADKFLTAVSPRYAAISCGKGNSYGHPAEETLRSLQNAGVEVSRTDEEGSIIYISDGKTIQMTNNISKEK